MSELDPGDPLAGFEAQNTVLFEATEVVLGHTLLPQGVFEVATLAESAPGNEVFLDKTSHWAGAWAEAVKRQTAAEPIVLQPGGSFDLK